MTLTFELDLWSR